MRNKEEQLNDQVGGGLEAESYQLVEREEHDIFEIVTTEHGSFVALGQNRLTNFDTKENCKKMVDSRNYDLILSLISLINKTRN